MTASTDTVAPAKVRLYSNDLELERFKYANALQSKDRLATLRNRVARAQATRLVMIAVVANENGDKTVARYARTKLQDLGVLNPGDKIADVYTVVESRRPSVSREVRRRAGRLAFAPKA